MNHFYPGMGATSSMYGEPWRKAFDGQYHDWPKWSGEKTLTGFAARLIEAHSIRPRDTVIGTSLGGIIACEIANQIDLECIVLISSARRKEEVSRVLSILHPLIDVTPIRFIQMISGKLSGDLADMFAQSDPAFMRSMCKAIFTWGGLSSDVPILRIHGSHDLIIPNTDAVDHKIDGGHLIVMTHPAECIEAIKEEHQAMVSTPLLASRSENRI